jgi:uncharacterized protein
MSRAVVCDTSALVALFDAAESANHAVARAVGAEEGPFVVSPFVLAELDDLLGSRRGVDAELAVLDELAGGAWDLAAFGAADVAAAREVIGHYADQAIGIADASLVVLANRYGTDKLLTLDRRHFSVVRALNGAKFALLP